MKSFLVIATWVCWAIIVLPAAFVRPSSTIEQTGALRYTTVALDLAEPETYASFMASLRAQLTGTMECHIPVTRAKAADAQRFVLVDLKTSSDKIVTLAIDVTSVYIVAYRDTTSDKKDRANFLSDAPTVAKKNLFKGATVRNIPFGGNYIALEKAAGQGRNSIELGLAKLEFAIESIYGKKTIDGKLEAKFLLIAIQMVSEAARFHYIETKVTESGSHGSFKPDPKVINLENNWGKISDEIHKSVTSKPPANCTNISPAINLINADGTQWKVDKIATIKPDLGILKFKDAKIIRIVSHFTRFVRSIIVDGEEDGDVLE